MRQQPRTDLVRVNVLVIDPTGVERACPANQTVYFVPFREEKFSKITTILSGDTAHQRPFSHSPCPQVAAYCKNVPLRKSSNAWAISSRVFMTNGP